MAEILFNGPVPKCDSSKNRQIRRFKAAGISRRSQLPCYAKTANAGSVANRELFSWLLDDLLEVEHVASALDSNGKIPRVRSKIAMREFKKVIRRQI